MMTSEFQQLMQRGMTIPQWKRFKESEEYAYRLYDTCGIDCLTAEERRSAAKVLSKVINDGWDVTLQGCVAEAGKRFPDWPKVKRHEFAWSKAEKIMMETGYLPPHFTQLCNCKQCGLVLLSKYQKDLTPASCSWCETGYLGGRDERK